MIERRNLLRLLAAAPMISSQALAENAKSFELRGDLARRFTDDGTAGTFIAYNAAAKTMVVSDSDRVKQAILPASTFKIANSIIALETGVVADPDRDVFKWDGVVRAFPDWNKDHTLRTAIAASAVPVYQEIARRIGQERMQAYVDKLDYGNRDIGGAPIDYFWLRGNLRISPLQQIEFLDRLRLGSHKVSARSQRLAYDIIPVTMVGETVIRAKSGLIGVDDKSTAASASVGWLVGFAEKADAKTEFALNLDIREPRHIASRAKLAQQLLSDIGAI
jgi:beta-lactamase class D